MNNSQSYIRLAQSASALGAGLLGFGLGAKWGSLMGDYGFIVIIAGAVIHVWGMYIMQMKQINEKNARIAKILWFSSWICLVALIAVIIYLLVTKK
jgi:hypothetical protein